MYPPLSNQNMGAAKSLASYSNTEIEAGARDSVPGTAMNKLHNPRKITFTPLCISISTISS